MSLFLVKNLVQLLIDAEGRSIRAPVEVLLRLCHRFPPAAVIQLGLKEG
jgi:hypothetical protein